MHKKAVRQGPPAGAPEGTVWFGGPIDGFRIHLRVFGEDLNPDDVTARLGCLPTDFETKGQPVVNSLGLSRIPKRGRWSLSIESKDCAEGSDVEDGIKTLLGRLPDDKEMWAALTRDFKVDLFCALFLDRTNQGLELSAETSKMLSDRNLLIGLDIYFDPPTGGE